ncbi:hypothetical protein [Paenibacillus monticola]|uniref:Uncharacterized protein n=1 Tax=Paenibacillus monticola TaxID=2666075 RepID=A0A7X2H8P1_9BACL|nr:hypothetical protein [Paenibacillus monticola]MRN55564.1 hypothetical protein [Paenibacillus monticola]
MGWSTSALRGIPNDYNDEAKKIDEQILGLIQQRKAISGGKRLFPEQEVLEQWAAKFDLELNQISLILSSLNEGLPRRHFWDEPGLLLGVLPIMKRIVTEDFEYVLSHAMQHEKLSIVTLEIKYLKETTDQVHIRPTLDLVVLSDTEYEVTRNHGHGGGGQIQMRFMVSPPLPNDLTSVEFSLVPGSDRFMGPSYEEIKLDKQIDFY